MDDLPVIRRHVVQFLRKKKDTTWPERIQRHPTKPVTCRKIRTMRPGEPKRKTLYQSCMPPVGEPEFLGDVFFFHDPVSKYCNQ